MSLRHCIAGIALVVVGCLAVKAYSDPPPVESTTVEVKPADNTTDKPADTPADTAELQARVKQLEERLNAAGQASDSDPLDAKVLRAELELEKMNRQKLEDRIVALTQDGKPPADSPPAAREREDTFTTAVWRFQFFPRLADQPPSERGTMVDTATGRCWSLSRRQPRWEDLGGPYEAAAERPAAEANAAAAPPAATNKKPAPALRLKGR